MTEQTLTPILKKTRVKDCSGQRFGKLTALNLAGRNHNGRVVWLCRCDCGGETFAVGVELRNGHTKSCGCLSAETARKNFKTHGLSKTRIYQIWLKMKSRCHNKKNNRYKRYGGRGIDICREWKDFKVFYDWSMSHGYSENLSIDRVDNDKGYDPSNCRWATEAVQQNNKSTNRYIKYKGEIKNLKSWCLALGLKYSTVSQRLFRGWSDEKALTTPTNMGEI